MIIWKPLFGECLQCVKEPTSEVKKILFLWFVLILTVKRSSRPCATEISMNASIFLSLRNCSLDIFVTGKHINHGKTWKRIKYKLEISGPEKDIKPIKK